jgi:beta-glucosidase-like glycosyl hydrolase
MKFHNSNFGKFGKSLETDDDGYCFTTVKEYMEKCKLSREHAKEAVEAVKAAEEKLNAWQDGKKKKQEDDDSLDEAAMIRQIVREEILLLLNEDAITKKIRIAKMNMNIKSRRS